MKVVHYLFRQSLLATTNYQEIYIHCARRMNKIRCVWVANPWCSYGLYKVFMQDLILKSSVNFTLRRDSCDEGGTHACA